MCYYLKLRNRTSWWCKQTKTYEGFWDNKFNPRWNKEVPRLESHYLLENTHMWTFEEFISEQTETYYCPTRTITFKPIDKWRK